MQKPESNTIAKQESSETDLSGLSLTDLASRLNERERSLSSIRDAILEKAAWAVKRALEQGRDLFEVHNRLEHGQWQPWISENCIFSYETALRYRKVFEKYGSVTDLDGLTLTQLYIGSGLIPGVEMKESKPHVLFRPFQWIAKCDEWLKTATLELETMQSDLPESEKRHLKDECLPKARTLVARLETL